MRNYYYINTLITHQYIDIIICVTYSLQLFNIIVQFPARMDTVSPICRYCRETDTFLLLFRKCYYFLPLQPSINTSPDENLQHLNTNIYKMFQTANLAAASFSHSFLLSTFSTSTPDYCTSII